MTECELEIDENDIRPGDVIQGWYDSGPGGRYIPAHGVRIAHSRVGDRLRVERGEDGRIMDDFHLFGGGSVSKWKVRRKMPVITTQPTYQGKFSLAPTPPQGTPIRKIPDWPLRCPRCQAANSAVLLFMGYDCKNGCYK